MIGGVFRHMLSHLSGVPHLHVTGAKNPSWPESNQLAIYKHGGGPELQATEKNQGGDFLQALYMRTHLLEILVLGNKYSKITLAVQLCRVQFFF